MTEIDKNAMVIVGLGMVEEGLEVIITPFGTQPHYKATAYRKGGDQAPGAMRSTRFAALTEALSLLRWMERKQA